MFDLMQLIFPLFSNRLVLSEQHPRIHGKPMQSPPRDQVVAVLADLVREAVSRGDEVHVPGLGTFHVEHRSSHIEEQPDGRVLMKPPRDEVAFTPES